MNTVYNEFLYQVLNQTLNLGSDTINVALLADTYTPDKDHVYFSEISSNVVLDNANGDTPLPSTLMTNVSLTKQDAGDNVMISADDVTWASVSVTARYAVIYKDTGSPETSPLILAYDFGSNQTSVNGNFSIQWSINGVATLSQAV